MTPEALAALVAAALPDEGLTAAELDTCCFGPDTVVLGDDKGAVAVTVRRDWTFAWILLVAVHPDRQRQGRGRALVDAAVEWARDQGAVELHLGSAIPRYVWPGVDYRFTAALCLFEACGFEDYGASCNMSISTSFRAPKPSGIVVEREISSGAIDLARRRFPEWEEEVTRSVAKGGCFSARDGDGSTLGFACHSVNRDALIGPMATDPDRQHGGVGNALLAALCEDIATRDGLAEADISWVGPVRFYAKAGASVSRVFRYGRLKLEPPSSSS